MEEDARWVIKSFVKSFDSVVSLVLRVHQVLNTLIYLVLKFSYGLYLPYMVCLV